MSRPLFALFPIPGRLRRIALAGLGASVLAGCPGSSGSPEPPPSNVQGFAGDAVVSFTWDDIGAYTYWLFYAQDPTLTPESIGSSTPLLNAGVMVPANSPVTLCNGPRQVINNPASADDPYPPIYVTLNARTGSAAGGPASAPVGVQPRPAAGAGAPWIAGYGFNGPVTALGYVPVVGCGYAGRPAEGLYLALTSNGYIYSSELAPTVAGPLTNPGNALMSWTLSTVPLGFTETLNAVAGRSSGSPGSNSLTLVAVGDGGSAIYSLDGKTWAASTPINTTSSLHDVAVSGSNFIAVGDAGVVVTSTNGITWSQPNPSAQAANPGGLPLRSIRCPNAGGTCMAVGDSGTVLYSGSGGTSWIALNHGSNNWIGVAYGNADANMDAVVSVSGSGAISVDSGAESINTWVIVDAGGDYAYSNHTIGEATQAWTDGAMTIAPNIVAIDYSSHFIALDSAGNAWYSELGSGSWASYTAAPITDNGAVAVAMRSNGYGFVAVGSSGENAAAF